MTTLLAAPSETVRALPAGWRIACVGDILKIRNGYAFKSTDYKETGVPLIRQSELKSDVIDLSEAKRVDPRFLEELSGFIVREGDLLIGMSGSLGKIAEYQNKEPALQNQRTGLLIMKPGYDAKFARLVLKLVEPQIVAEGKGVAVQNVSAKEIEACTFLLPPANDQRRIVAEIEQQFTRLDAGVAALRRTQANLKRYRAAVLKAACEGRLVPTEAELARAKPRVLGSIPSKNNAGNFESGVALLERILTTRREKWIGRAKYKEPIVPHTQNLPSLPHGWTWAPFGFLGEDPNNTVQTGPFGAQLHNTEFTESGVPVIAVGNLTGTGFRTDGLYFVDKAKAKQLARYDVWAGDVLFARSGATLGKVCVAPVEVQDWRMTGHILRARLNRSFIDPKIAVYALAASPAVRKQVFGNVRGVTRPGFNTGLLESILIPVPPLAEQTRIIAEVERRLSVVDELETVVKANLQRASRLRQSILQQAFS
jgi:type I restriction enzyme, S subunit